MIEESTSRRETVLTLRVTDSEAREFRLAARAERTSVSEMIRRAVRDRAETLTTGRGTDR